jgi:2,4'-dihydroxyacetophenone dioxygenase
MTNLKKLLVSTAHAQFDNYPWIEFLPGQELKVVQARLADNLTVIQFRAQPGVRSGLHRHMGFVFGVTTKGAWSHDPDDFAYHPNSYVCEPLGELHRFYNGPQVTEACYISIGDTEYFDDEGREVVGRSDPAKLVTEYLAKCEERRLPRPNVLR